MIARFRMVPDSKGGLVVSVDHYEPFTVRGLQADVLVALSRDLRPLGDGGDPLVSYKSADKLLDMLNERRAKQVTRHGLVVTISRLRRHLGHWLPDGGSLIQTKRGVGWRLALLRPAANRSWRR